MKKINLFLIAGFREQTAKYLAYNRALLALEGRGRSEHVSAIRRHIYVLSKFFELHDFFENRDRLASYEHPLVFHIPYGLENRKTGVEEALLSLKGRVPIAARSYDPHSPIKMSREYLAKHHDIVFTYNEALVDGAQFRYSPVVYDSHLVGADEENTNRSRLCCMILGNKFSATGPTKEGYEIFAHGDGRIENIYAERDKFAADRRIDVYGRGWHGALPNYRGALFPFDRKYAVARRYRFSVALENCGMETYISEKILDAMLTLTVPVYFGAPNIAKHIPADCFVHARDHADCRTLVDHLVAMSPERYAAYVDHIRRNRDAVFERFSTPRNIALPLYRWYRETCGPVDVPTDEDVKAIATRLARLKLTRNAGQVRGMASAWAHALKRRFVRHS